MHPSWRALLFLVLGFLASRPLPASDPISAPVGGQSPTVTQPHVTAELIPEKSIVQAGSTLEVILHLHMDPDWHTYWINPGDAGLATAIKWTLPPGWSAGPIQWPTPEVHAMGPLTTYGYGGDVYLVSTLKVAPASASPQGDVAIQANATWLVCQEECVPGQANLDLKLTVVQPGEKLGTRDTDNSTLFAAARSRLPVPNTSWGNWEVMGAYRVNQLTLSFQIKGGAAVPAGKLSFFAEQPNVIGTKSVELQPNGPNGSPDFEAHLSLTQNGEKPDHLSGILVSDQPLIGSTLKTIIGDPKAIYFASFPVETSTAAVPAAPPSPVAASVVPPTGAGSATPGSDAAVPPPFLPAILGAAFLGGLILNLMPCVLPVLSLKVFSLIRHAGDGQSGAWKQGVAFAAGVLVSFWILAGLLIALESAGHHLGWGFQMQSPGFVLALIFLFFLLGLNLFGVFELGGSLVGLDVKSTSHLGGLTSSFANGALATLAATPCTAPFMGSAVGFAAQQPAVISLLVFTALALGMAAPYLALTVFPGALRLVPKPGAWMEALKQFMGFLLMGTVIFLVYVFGALTGAETVPMLLGALLLAGLAAWIYGRWSSPVRSVATRTISFLAALIVLGAAVAWGAQLAQVAPASSSDRQADGWQPWSPDAVKQALAQQHPAFVDFTAAWCLSCKVNERVALDIDSTKKLFTDKHVALFRGDWTQNDPQITETLRKYNRDGVPLYLLYSPKNPDTPQVLPEVLTPQIVQDAVLGRHSAEDHAWPLGIVAALGLLLLGGLAAWLQASRVPVAKGASELRI